MKRWIAKAGMSALIVGVLGTLVACGGSPAGDGENSKPAPAAQTAPAEKSKKFGTITAFDQSAGLLTLKGRTSVTVVGIEDKTVIQLLTDPARGFEPATAEDLKVGMTASISFIDDDGRNVAKQVSAAKDEATWIAVKGARAPKPSRP